VTAESGLFSHSAEISPRKGYLRWSKPDAPTVTKIDVQAKPKGIAVRRALSSVISVGLVAMMGGISAEAASAAPKPKKYANCAALHKVYPHGVGRTTAARDKTTKLDRDKDKIACEKR
jgi:hypothetical protein